MLEDKPTHMNGVIETPLFVLPMGLFPHTVEPLRVFEPRYKQMLDDCVLNDKPFGYVAANPTLDDIKGWSPPSEYGVLTLAQDLEEQGTNLVFTAHGNVRFRIIKVIPAALPAMPFGDIFPSVDELVEEYIDEDPNGKLYLRAEIQQLPALSGAVEPSRWEALVQSWAKYLVIVDSLLRSSGLDLEDVLAIMEEEFMTYSESGLWSACQSVLTEHEERQSALASEDVDQVIAILEDSINEKMIQIDFIQSMLDKEE